MFLVLTIAATLHLVNVDGGMKTELGCLNCSRFSSDSVCNQNGLYGSKFSNTIWNPNGSVGSKFSSGSPWNKHSQPTVRVVDESGNSYGYFTINKYATNRTTVPALVSFLDEASESNNPADAFSILCGR